MQYVGAGLRPALSDNYTEGGSETRPYSMIASQARDGVRITAPQIRSCIYEHSN